MHKVIWSNNKSRPVRMHIPQIYNCGCVFLASPACCLFCIFNSHTSYSYTRKHQRNEWKRNCKTFFSYVISFWDFFSFSIHQAYLKEELFYFCNIITFYRESNNFLTYVLWLRICILFYRKKWSCVKGNIPRGGISFFPHLFLYIPQCGINSRGNN